VSVRVHADGHTDGHTDKGKLVFLSVPCYMLYAMGQIIISRVG